jgi:hypothetical protein
VLPIPIFPLWFLAAPLVAAVALWNLCKRRNEWRLIPYFVSLIAHLGGLEVDVGRGASQSVQIRFI